MTEHRAHITYLPSLGVWVGFCDRCGGITLPGGDGTEASARQDCARHIQANA